MWVLLLLSLPDFSCDLAVGVLATMKSHEEETNLVQAEVVSLLPLLQLLEEQPQQLQQRKRKKKRRKSRKKRRTR